MTLELETPVSLTPPSLIFTGLQGGLPATVDAEPSIQERIEELRRYVNNPDNLRKPDYTAKVKELERLTALLEDTKVKQKGSKTKQTHLLPSAELVDTRIAPPKATQAMFSGLVGRVAEAATKDTGINPVAVAANFLAFLGAMAGRDMYFPVGDSRHHPRLFTLHIGRSSIAGKGDSLRLVRMIATELAAMNPSLLGRIHDGGLSSKEGLAMLIHDGFTQGRDVVAPIHDKRLWVVEEEFGNVLQQGKREGNTLSEGLRGGWDGRSIQPAIKGLRIWAKNPHIGIAGGITPHELHKLITGRDLFNGFANRFLMFWAERTRKEAFPTPTPTQVATRLAAETFDVIKYAKGNYPEEQDTRPMTMNHHAQEFYRDAYHSLDRHTESELLASLLERRAPHLIRLGMLFAQCDLSPVIKECHLQAAQAWVDYNTQSVRYVFAHQANEAKTVEKEAMADKIAAYLVSRPDGASLTSITNECFQKNQTPQPIGEVLDMMLVDRRYNMELETVPRADGRGGRQRKIYRLHEICSGINGHSFLPEMARVSEDNMRTEFDGHSNFNPQNGDQKSQTPSISVHAETSETRMDIEENQCPLIPGQTSNIPLKFL